MRNIMNIRYAILELLRADRRTNREAGWQTGGRGEAKRRVFLTGLELEPLRQTGEDGSSGHPGSTTGTDSHPSRRP
jgi:hypothetical protein